MLLYELRTRKSYFQGKGDSLITKTLSYLDKTDLSAVADDQLRDLINQCLRINPKKRPGNAQILLHPYFLTTGIGPFSF